MKLNLGVNNTGGMPRPRDVSCEYQRLDCSHSSVPSHFFPSIIVFLIFSRSILIIMVRHAISDKRLHRSSSIVRGGQLGSSALAQFHLPPSAPKMTKMATEDRSIPQSSTAGRESVHSKPCHQFCCFSADGSRKRFLRRHTGERIHRRKRLET